MLLLKSHFSSNLYFLFETSALILGIYTTPFYILDYVTNLSNNFYINWFCYLIKYLCFVVPMLPIIYFIIGQKITKFISFNYQSYKNASHIYGNVIISSAYLLLSIFSQTHIYASILLNTITYSIYISEIIYNFIDYDKYKFNNIIDFYNYNKFDFLLIGSLFSISSYYVPIQLVPLYYFLFTIIFTPMLIVRDFNIFNPLINRFNLFYILEIPINFIILIINSFLQNNVTIKNIKKNL